MVDLDALVRDYNEACSSGSLADVMAFFAEDAVIYDLNHAPVVGREAIGRFWGHVRGKWGGARWSTDSVIAQARSAAAEWTMSGVADGHAFTFRGVDIFHVNDDGLLREVRQYWRFDPDDLTSGLVGFDYGD